jgi:uncharacterized UPF0160 family protein
VTHDGIFRLDEIIAIAIIAIVEEDKYVRLFRSRDQKDIEQFAESPKAYIVDVGGVYDPSRNRFDHHQDKNLRSAAGLVFERFAFDLGLRDVEARNHFDNFIKGIDEADTNESQFHQRWKDAGFQIRGLHEVISGFNRLDEGLDAQFDAFQIAIKFAKQIVKNEIRLANQASEYVEAYKNGDF